jgi:hypothetical protein
MLDSCGYRLRLEYDFDEVRAKYALTSNSYHQVNCAIKCLLVNLDEPAKQVLERAYEWVQIAMVEDEDRSTSAPGSMKGDRFETLAMCKWLLHNEHDAESYRQAAHYCDDVMAIQNAYTNKSAVSLSLPLFAAAGAYERALEIFFGCPKLSPPKSLNAINNEAQMVYVLARQHLGLEPNAAAVAAGAEKFLRKHIDGWLSGGHQNRAADWLKILHWNDTDRRLTAKQVIMKCYDYLPGRTPPE